MKLDMNNDILDINYQEIPSSQVNLSPGHCFILNNIEYIIITALDSQSLLCRNCHSGIEEKLDISTVVSSGAKTINTSHPDVLSLSDKDWKKINERFEAIRPLLDIPGHLRKGEAVESRAQETGYSVPTMWRWLSRYLRQGKKSALVPHRRKDKGNLRLGRDIEKVITNAIQNLYLTKQKITPGRLVEEVNAVCRKRDLKAPHPNTIRYRLRFIPNKIMHRKRQGVYAASSKYDPISENYNQAQWPLAVVQIDHTLADIMLVDDINRTSLGRPWLTLAMDIYSRMVVGFYVSLDPPNETAVGICVTDAILPKEGQLIEYDINAEWPVWGKMDILHADNAKEFRSNMVTKACGEYGIDMHWRPVKKPHYGGHIERLMGTMGKEIHSLPGTTFSNPQQRGDYDSEKQAAFTLQEFKKWLLTHILCVYHNTLHSGINSTPLARYKEGLNANGIPPRVMDQEQLKLDFLPCIERSIQRQGVSIDGVIYYHDSLRRWIGSKENGKPRQFVFRRDPRDISAVSFFDPEIKKYFRIPFRNNTHGFTSLWEFRRAKEQVRKDAYSKVSEDEIFKARDEMRQMVDSAVAKSKKARRLQQRLNTSRSMTSNKGKNEATDVSNNYADLNIDINNIKPFPVDESE